MREVAEVDVGAGCRVFNQVADLFVEPLSCLKACIALLISGFERRERRQCDFHIRSRELVHIAGKCVLVDSLLEKYSERRALSAWRQFTLVDIAPSTPAPSSP